MTIYSRMSPPTGFYVYAYLRENGTPYYIGKGSGDRAWNVNHTIHLPVLKTNIIIIEANLTEVGALAIERRLIRWYGRKDNSTGLLRNGTAGGDGTSGIVVTEETRKRRSLSLKGKNLGKTHSPETRKKMSRPAWNKGMVGKQKHSADTKSKMSLSHLGRTLSEEQRKRLSIAFTGHKKATTCCPHCGLVGGKGNMFRYHFDNCKLLSI